MRVPASPETWTKPTTGQTTWPGEIELSTICFPSNSWIFSMTHIIDYNQLNDDYSKEGENSRVEELKNII